MDVQNYKRGLNHWSDGRITEFELDAVASPRLSMLDSDHLGRVWAGLEDGRIAIMQQNGRVQTFGPADGVNAGVYRQVWRGLSGPVWLAGTEGLTQFHERKGVFTSLRPETGFPTRDLTAVIGDDSGNL